MDVMDVIVIEDSPPSSPVKTKTIRPKPKHKSFIPKPLKMNYIPRNPEFPVPEQAMIWSKHTTNFIKQSMNSIQNNRMPLMSNVQKPAQYGSFLPRNGYSVGLQNYPRPPYTLYDPVNSYIQRNGFGPIRNSNYLNNLYNRNFWMKVKLEELPEKGEIVSQYYIDENQTPIEINQNEPEFVDITTLMNKNNVQTKENLNLSTKIDDKKRKSPVPPFLKRNKPANNMKIPEEISSNNNNEDADDIIFLGEFKRDMFPEITITPIKNEPKTGSKSSISSEDSTKKEMLMKSKPSFNFGKKNRKDKTLIPVRRNPKRQVQIEKDFMRMIDDAILESEREEKQKKNGGIKNKLGRPAIKQYRRSPRTVCNSGAVYRPPSPLTNAHIRAWPTDGMHERPEYDPISGKIYPFDSYIRNIASGYKNEDDTADPHKTDFYNEDSYKTFPEVCHEMLHHVMAYVATVKMLERNEKTSSNKEVFLENFDLANNDNNMEDVVCDALHSIVDDIIQNKESEVNNDSLQDLLKNSVLLYCLTNNVDRKKVAKYIATVKPEDIIKLSNEKFKIQ